MIKRLFLSLVLPALLLGCGSGAAPVSAPASASSAATSPAAAAAIKPLPQRMELKISFNPQTTQYLPVFWAINKGYFQQAGLDISLTSFQGSSSTQIPILAKGDIDISGSAPTPALYNQVAQGFSVKIIAGMGEPKKGRLEPAWLNVVKDKANEIKDLKDLKGHSIDGGAEGTPIQLLALEAIRQAGLKNTDVTLTYRGRTTPDELALLKNKGADVVGIIEPLATQSEQQGLAVRWKSYSDLVPWYQGVLLAASAKALDEKHAAVEKFLEVYLQACREIDAANGAWTPELIALMAKNAGVTPDAITSQGGVPYYDPNGRIVMDSLKNTQDLLVQQQQVKQPVDISQMVDTQTIDQAAQAIGRASA